MGGVQWSTNLQQYRSCIELWSMVHSKKLGCQISTTWIRRFMRKTGVRDALTVSCGTAHANLQKAKRDYKRAKKMAPEWRNNHLYDLAKAKAAENSTGYEC
jgi:hypothetical protein